MTRTSLMEQAIQKTERHGKFAGTTKSPNSNVKTSNKAMRWIFKQSSNPLPSVHRAASGKDKERYFEQLLEKMEDFTIQFTQGYEYDKKSTGVFIEDSNKKINNFSGELTNLTKRIRDSESTNIMKIDESHATLLATMESFRTSLKEHQVLLAATKKEINEAVKGNVTHDEMSDLLKPVKLEGRKRHEKLSNKLARYQTDAKVKQSAISKKCRSIETEVARVKTEINKTPKGFKGDINNGMYELS